MKIAVLGSAPSSLHLAPFGDPNWKVWGCSPGVYPYAPRVDAWFETHRWEPGVIGKPATQKQWFSPEYVAWMGQLRCPVWMYAPVPEIPMSRALPVEDLTSKYGTFFFTSSIAWMIACAIEDILEERAKLDEARKNGVPIPPLEDAIGLWGVDMAASEEYGFQRAGCQHFLLLAADLGIEIIVPPESDLLRPMPLYGICESSHFHIKATARRKELESRKAAAENAIAMAQREASFVTGALADHEYHCWTWGEDRTGMGIDPAILARSPKLQAEVEKLKPSMPGLQKLGPPRIVPPGSASPMPQDGEAGQAA